MYCLPGFVFSFTQCLKFHINMDRASMFSSPPYSVYGEPFQYEFYFFPFFKILFYFLTLQYCIGFAIYRNESATGIHVFPILNPPPSPYHPSGSSQGTSPKHPVSCIKPGLVTRFIYYTYFNAILPNHPTLSLSHRVQKTVLYITVSFAVSYTGLLLPSF